MTPSTRPPSRPRDAPEPPPEPGLRLVDTHSHLGFDAFDEDRADVVARARLAGVLACLAVAVDAPSARRALALQDETGGWAVPTAGIHPNEQAVTTPDAFAEIDDLARSGRVCAVGETGLDLYWDDVPLAAQVASLDRHLRLALDTGLPVVLHCRDAFPELREAVGHFAGGGLRGVVHCFTGTAADVEWIIEAGLHVGVGGVTTFKANGALREAVGHVPDERLLLETDAPFLAPMPMRGRRNEPAFVAHTAGHLAAERGREPAEIAELTTVNAQELFRLEVSPPRPPA